MNLSVSPIPFPLVFSWLYVLHPNPIAKTPTDRQGGQPRSDHDDPATYEWGGSKNINPPYHLITQETISVKKESCAVKDGRQSLAFERTPNAGRGARCRPCPRVLRAAGRQAERSRRWLSQPRSMGQRQTGESGRGEGREEGKRGKQGRIGQHVHTRTQPRTAKGAAEED